MQLSVNMLEIGNACDCRNKGVIRPNSAPPPALVDKILLISMTPAPARAAERATSSVYHVVEHDG